MANPWLKKNPFMSMWLSGANAAAGSIRGKAVAAAKRQSTAAINDATHEVIKAWTAGLATPAAPRRKKARGR